MYHGNYPAIGTDRGTNVSDTPSPAGTVADMSRLPSMPSRPLPHHSYSNWGPSYRTDVGPSRPDIVNPVLQPREPEAFSNTQQLPSLRTLLQDQLEGRIPSPQSADPSQSTNSSDRYGSASPTLRKRRHDFDSYSHERSNSVASVSARAPPVLRHAHSAAGSETQPFHTPTCTPGPPVSDFARHPRPLQSEPVAKIHRTPSTASGISGTGDPTSRPSMLPSHEDAMDTVRGISRKRVEMSHRAPVRSSRYVGQREIKGEGLCYVYEDGSYCQAIIDGEPVNPTWGITKAGKPRKRLAQACLTCREKKIKCEPAFPKCNQCAKSQRECRGGLNQPSISNAPEERSPSGSAVRFSSRSTERISPVTGHEKSKSSQELRPLPSFESTPRSDPWHRSRSPLKHLKQFQAGPSAVYRDMSVHSPDTDWSGSGNDPEPANHHVDQLALSWEQDPYESNRQLAAHLLDLYFTHAGRATYAIFPPRQFRSWVETNRDKSQDDRMLLYSILAMGSIFSNDNEIRSAGKQFAAIAAYAIEKRFGKFTLQLCQSRLILGLWHFARGKAQEAWDFCGAALRAISALRLNIEEGIKDYLDVSDVAFGFDRLTLEECCRRTFWSGFLMDRYNGFCGGTLCVINPEDTFLKLPSPENVYFDGRAFDAPLFDFELLSRNTPPNLALGSMAQLTLISAIWGEVLTYTSRAVHRPESGYERNYEAFYSKTYERLDAWMGQLPPHLHYSLQNLDRSIVEGYAGTFVSLHSLYHTSCLRLNRHVRVSALSPQLIHRNLLRCFHDANSFLSLAQALSPQARSQRLPSSQNFSFSTPFPGYALMISIDVLSSGCVLTHLPDLIASIDSTVSCVDELAEFWSSARAQQKAISNRLKNLADVLVTEQGAERNGSPLWRSTVSLETAFSHNDDLVYGADDGVYFDVLEEMGRSS